MASISPNDSAADRRGNRTEEKGRDRDEEARTLRAAISMDDSSHQDNTVAGRSVNFRGSDGRSLDIGDGENHRET